ncbi:MAG: biotin/lipoyl-containing protein [Bacteroidales bacterium]|jgi:biotin carboxyl carrier protein|nr:biotin/lipoyl-containing protein [Bacteroidales bacterium]NLM92147.1 biotin/lipoyl-binding protein [Bacteroidales bacterium]
MKKYKFTIHGNVYEVNILNVEDNVIDLEVNGSSYQVEVDKTIQPVKTPKLVRQRVVPDTESTPSVGTGAKSPAAASGTIKSPLPGTILSILCKVGDSVKVGQKLMILEAMKMENNIDSDKQGTIVAIKVNPGQSVMEGDVLIEIGA